MDEGMDDRPGVAYRRPAGDPDRFVVESGSDPDVPLAATDADAFLSAVHPADRDALRDALDRDGRDGDRADAVDLTYRLRIVDGDRDGDAAAGDTVRVHERGRWVDGDVVGYLLSTAPDPRREELERAESLLDSLFESLPVHLYVKDAEGRHLRVSAGSAERYDEELVGKRDTDLESVDEAHRRAAYEDDMRVIETGEPVVDEVEYVEAFDTWNLTTKVPWRRDGEVVGLIGISWDVTEWMSHQRELETQRERLAEFASVVSHDLRNPLSVAVGNLDLARELDGDAASERLDRVEDALDRMDALVGDVLALAREGRTVEDPVETPLETVVDRAWRTVDAESATLRIVDDLGLVDCDRGRLRQVFENLARNAVEHAGPDATITVGRLDDGFYVADDGPGIAPEDGAEVFDPGYTTDPDGTGFGLAIVERIVEAHGWEVRVASATDEPATDGVEDDAGARFEFTGVDLRETGDADGPSPRSEGGAERGMEEGEERGVEERGETAGATVGGGDGETEGTGGGGDGGDGGGGGTPAE